MRCVARPLLWCVHVTCSGLTDVLNRSVLLKMPPSVPGNVRPTPLWTAEARVCQSAWTYGNWPPAVEPPPVRGNQSETISHFGLADMPFVVRAPVRLPPTSTLFGFVG